MARVSITSGYYGDSTHDHYSSSGTASSGLPSAYVPQLYAKKTLVKFYKDTVFSDITNTDYQGQFKNQGDTVIIRQRPDITVNSYAIGGTVTYEVPKEDYTSMTIDQAKYMAFKVDDIDAVQTDMNLVNEFASDAAEQLKISVDTDVLSIMGAGAHASNKGTSAGAISGNIDLGTTGSAVAVTATNAVDYIVYINQILDEQNVPSEGRFVVLPAWYCSLLKTGDLRRADITGDGTGIIRTGLIGQIDRTMIYMNNNLPTASDSGTKYTVVAGTKHATSFAMQLSKSDTLKIQDSFGEYWRTLYVYGRKVVKSDALVNLYCYKG